MTDIIYYREKPIRRRKIKSTWYYVLKDVMHAVGDIKDTKSAIKTIRKQDEDIKERWEKLVKRPEVNTNKAPQNVNSASLKNLKLILRSKKSWPTDEFFHWLEKVDTK